MAGKPTITTLPAGAKYDTSTLTGNFQAIRDAFDSMVGRAGTGGTNNAMTGDLDFDGNNILNAGSLGLDSSESRAEAAADSAESSSASADSSKSAAATSADSAESSSASANSSESSAASSESAANSSESAAAVSADSAESSAVSADSAESTAVTAADSSESSAASVGTSADSAESSSASADSSESKSASSESNAASSESAAASSESNAAGSESAAASSESKAAASESAATAADDKRVKISSDDDSAGYIEEKFLADSGLVVSVESGGNNERFLIGVDSVLQGMISNSAVDSNSIKAGAVTNTHIDSGAAIQVNALATSDSGSMLYYDSDGVATVLTQGSAAQVLTMSGGLPTWATAAAGGAWTAIASVEPDSSTSSILFDSGIDSTHAMLAFVFEQFDMAAAGVGIGLRCNSDSATSYGFHQQYSAWDSATYVSAADSNYTELFFGKSLQRDVVAFNGVVYVWGYADSSGPTAAAWTGVGGDDTAVFPGIAHGFAQYQNDSIVTSLLLVSNNNNFNTGRVTMYGITR